MLIEVVRDSTQEIRRADFEGYCGPGARVMLTIPTVVVESSPRSRAMSPIVEFSLSTGRGGRRTGRLEPDRRVPALADSRAP